MTPGDPRVSVIIPAYNRAAGLHRALDSVQAQDFVDYEVIVVDDASTDGTGAVVTDRGDARFRLLRHDRNRGAAAARNTGVAAARGGILAFLDSDDLWLPGKLATQVADLDARPWSGAATTTAFLYRRAGRQTLRRPEAPRGWKTELLDLCTVSPGSTLMVRRDAFAAIGPFDAGLGRLEDWDWLLRYLRRFELAVLPDALALIDNASAPDPMVVAAAARAMLAGQRPFLTAAEGRRLAASLTLEVAFAHAMRRRYPAAIGKVAAAGLLSPGRVLRLVRRVARRLSP